MAEERSIPNGVSPESDGKGLWCVYCDKFGSAIGIAKVEKIFMGGHSLSILFSERSTSQFWLGEYLYRFADPWEAIKKFSEMRGELPQEVRRIFEGTFPSASVQENDLAA